MIPRGPRGIARTSQRSRYNQRDGHFRGRPVVMPGDNWHTWTEITLKLTGLPDQIETLDVYHLLQHHGNISRIDLLEDNRGKKTGEAFVDFCPPPPTAFWDQLDLLGRHEQWKWLAISLMPKKRNFTHPSPVNPMKRYPEHMKLAPSSLEFGFMHDREEMMVMHKVDGGLAFLLNLLRREIVIFFSMMTSKGAQPTLKSASNSTLSMLDDSQVKHYKFQIPLFQLATVWEMESENGQRILVFPTDAPVRFYRQLHDIDSTHDGGKRWYERSTWARQTDIVSDNHALRHAPVTLRKRAAVLDIGRWTTYRLVFDKSPSSTIVYNLIKEALTDYNIKILSGDNFSTVARQEPAVWNLIDSADHNTTSLGSAFLADMASKILHLSWPIRYQLEACISQGVLHEHNITEDFISKLTMLPDRQALLKLEYAVEKKQRFFNPDGIFSLQVPMTAIPKKMPKHCITSRSATVTPSTVYYTSPSTDMSNRILRQYREHEDRFLRVRFTDEKLEGRINSTTDDTQDAMYTRVYRCLKNGIQIGDRHYEFLAMGNSQFREHGAYFFSSTAALTAAEIRSRMGTFDEIRVVAKWASRLGQCFSTTRAIRGTKVKLVEIEDIKRNTYNFTDGVGKISKFVAQIIAGEMGLPNPWNDPPSVFQFRLGGAKGVLAISPDAKLNEVHIRESQYKFPATYQGLEINRCASFTTVVLNRQLISILTCLGIGQIVFLKKMKDELEDLHNAMTNESIALRKLQERIDFNQMTLTLASIMLDGFMSARDPFAVSILHLWRSWTTKTLKEKAGLPIKQGAFVFGCTDETGTLQGHFNRIQNAEYSCIEERILALPQIFIQVDPLRTGTYQVIEKVCIVARNPSLHPGDVRVVRAVDNPQLHHLKNVVVFPQTGDRDIPNMCSGGDLDGDDFVVIWDEELIPGVDNWNIEAMTFDGPKPEPLDRPVVIDDVIPFFVNYMKKDTLRPIATAHLATADRSPDGVWDTRCIKLAELHSIAVDFPKSGIPAGMHPTLRPRVWPHFMDWGRRHKETYHSKTVLGQLYDEVKEIDFLPLIHPPFDERILEAYPTDEHLMGIAKELKLEYDAAMRRIMAQHEIKTEFEVWTTFVLSHARLSNDYSFHEEIGRLADSLRERFHDACYSKAGGRDFEDIAPLVAAMYAVTAQDVATKIEQLKESNQVEEHEDGIPQIKHKDMPLLSFPWLFHKELGMIANGRNLGSASVKALQGASRHLRKANQLVDVDEYQDDVETAEGVTHRGDLLELFHDQGAAMDHIAMVDKGISDGAFAAQAREKFGVYHALTQLGDWGGAAAAGGVEEDLMSIDGDDVAADAVETPRGQTAHGNHVEEVDEVEDGEIVEIEMGEGLSALELLQEMHTTGGVGAATAHGHLHQKHEPEEGRVLDFEMEDEPAAFEQFQHMRTQRRMLAVGNGLGTAAAHGNHNGNGNGGEDEEEEEEGELVEIDMADEPSALELLERMVQ